MSSPYIIRLPHERNFTIVPNPVIDNRLLSPEARFLIIALLRQRTDYRPTFAGMQNLMGGCGKKLLNRVLRELRENGFAKCDVWQEHGLFKSQYFFSEYPYPPAWNIEPPAKGVSDTDTAPAKRRKTDPLESAFARINVTDQDFVREWVSLAKVEFSANYRRKVGGVFRFGTIHLSRLRELLTFIVLDFVDEGRATQSPATGTGSDVLQRFISGRLRTVFNYSKLTAPGHYTPAYICQVYNDAKAGATVKF